jgi:uncharacterized membrane protein HdeD (DUF308 family)
MNEPHPARWKSRAGLGLLCVLLGLFLLFATGPAADLAAALAGAAIIVLSAVFIAEGIFLDTGGWPRATYLVLGIPGIVLGIAAIVVPSALVVTTGLLMGAFLVLYGIAELAIGIGFVVAEPMVRMLFIMLGAFSSIVGLFLILNPALGIEIFLRLLGLYLLVLGMMRVVCGLNEREAESTNAVRRL